MNFAQQKKFQNPNSSFKTEWKRKRHIFSRFRFHQKATASGASASGASASSTSATASASTSLHRVIVLIHSKEPPGICVSNRYHLFAEITLERRS
jgi:hypothetical protein